MKYKAYLLRQQECDHGNGCSRGVIDIEANSLDEAKQQLFEHIKEECVGGERLQSAELYEINTVLVFDLVDCYAQIERENRDAANDALNAKERLDLVRLLKKHGPPPFEP